MTRTRYVNRELIDTGENRPLAPFKLTHIDFAIVTIWKKTLSACIRAIAMLTPSRKLFPAPLHFRCLRF